MMSSVAVNMKDAWWSQGSQGVTKIKAQKVREVLVVRQRRREGISAMPLSSRKTFYEPQI